MDTLVILLVFLVGGLLGVLISNHINHKTIKVLKDEVRFKEKTIDQLKGDVWTYFNHGRKDLLKQLVDSWNKEVK